MTMYAFGRKQADGHRVLVIGVAVAYLAITSLIPFLHSDDCPVAHGADARDTSFPSGAPCPACKFVAGSNSVEMQYDSTPAVIEARLPLESACQESLITANPCAGLILLRAPPTFSLS